MFHDYWPMNGIRLNEDAMMDFSCAFHSPFSPPDSFNRHHHHHLHQVECSNYFFIHFDFLPSEKCSRMNYVIMVRDERNNRLLDGNDFGES